MNILDENIIESPRQLLRSWKIRVRQIGVDIGRKGIKDDEIIPLLLTCPRPTFFTRDLGFYDRKLCHARYCILCLEVGRYEVATSVRFFLRHSAFNTHAKRMETRSCEDRAKGFMFGNSMKTVRIFCPGRQGIGTMVTQS